MINKVEQEGYAAFDKATGKGLANIWTGAAQTGNLRQSLLLDPEKISVDDEKIIKKYIEWYNDTHKKPIEFEIKKVKKISLCEIEIKE